MNYIRQFFDQILFVLYPPTCIGCREKYPVASSKFCVKCLLEIPYTNQWNLHQNEFISHFQGRIKIQHGSALLFYAKQGMAHNILQLFKYHGRKDIGKYLGQILGEKLQESPYYQDIDVIIPVPLHWIKYRQRGFNQSEILAKFISNSINVPYFTKYLFRKKYTFSQTKKSRIGRFANLEKAFNVRNSKELVNKHVLLVDDVLTTGATLESCAQKILEIPGTKVSMATLAMGTS